MTQRGPANAAGLERGVDRVWMVSRDGEFVLSPVQEVAQGGDVKAWRLLTEAGDVVVPAGMLAQTSDGPLDGGQVDVALVRREVVRLDIVSPEDLPPPHSPSGSAAEVYRSCLAALPANVIQLPRGNGVGEGLLAELVSVVREAGVGYSLVADDRWTTLVLDPVEATAGAARAEWELQADVMAMLTAWDAHSQGYESRVRLCDSELRCRVIASLAGARRTFWVRWLPGYAPVEARIRVAGDRSWPARFAVHAAHPFVATTHVLETPVLGDLIVSLAVLRAS